MGSRFSKALRPHKATAASVSPAQHDTINTTEQQQRQDTSTINAHETLNEVIPPVFLWRDDLDMATPPPVSASRRRNSAPVPHSSVAARADPNRIRCIEMFEQFIDERGMLSIDYEPGEPLSGDLPLPPPPPPPVVSQPEDNSLVCIICSTELPQKNDPKYAATVMKPCRSCNSEYCTSCIKEMFTAACSDMSRMPPRCCVQLHLHHAKPLLNQDEILLFRAKYEEWSTPHPAYCPVPVCSAFIPTRLLPEKVRSKGSDRQRVDSGVGTLAGNTFACPTCTADICTACRQTAHPGINCEINEFGLDAETAALLKSWGYKKCPKCGHGIKRMYGCDHMACRCGAQFCWQCLQSKEMCDDNGCEGGDGDYEEDDDDSPEEPEDEGQDNNDTSTDPTSAEGAPLIRPRNLDGGGAVRWENSALDFGDEPRTDNVHDRAWECEHDFQTHEIPLADVLSQTHATGEMECVHCWSTIYPAIAKPHGAQSNDHTNVMVAASAIRIRRGLGRERGVVRRRTANYVPPRGLFRFDATVGTAPHLTSTIQTSPLSQSVPTRYPAPIHDMPFTSRVTDAYGNIITASPMPTERRASICGSHDVLAADEDVVMDKPFDKLSPWTDVFTPIQPNFSLAYECFNCQVLLCGRCKDAAEGKEGEKSGGEEPEKTQRQEAEEFDPGVHMHGLMQ